MRKKSVLIILLTVTLLCLSSGAFAEEEKKDEAAQSDAAKMTDSQKTSYCLGIQLGNSLKRVSDSLDRASFIRGLEDMLDGKTPALTEDEIRQALQEFQKNMVAKQQKEFQEQSEKNTAQQKAFLEENAKKEGVVALPSGLQYQVITEGSGASPSATDRVKVNYVGTFPDGKEFDSSVKRGTPAEFQVNKVIKGWTEALQNMKTGAKWKLFVPADLAYGAQGRAGIGPNQMLIFEVELLEVLPSAAVEVPATPATPAAPATSADSVKGSS